MKCKCKKCGAEFDAKYAAVWICPKCSSMDGDIEPAIQLKIQKTSPISFCHNKIR